MRNAQSRIPKAAAYFKDVPTELEATLAGRALARVSTNGQVRIKDSDEYQFESSSIAVCFEVSALFSTFSPRSNHLSITVCAWSGGSWAYLLITPQFECW